MTSAAIKHNIEKRASVATLRMAAGAHHIDSRRMNTRTKCFAPEQTNCSGSRRQPRTAALSKYG
eukprot:3458523-Pleurochrysis_carterae.AAC.1